MHRSLADSISSLVGSISEISDVRSIGKSGGEKLPAQNEGDIDIFVFCSQVPGKHRRNEAIGKPGNAVTDARLSETAGRFWGVCDFVHISGIEICLMYFTTRDIDDEIESVLDGTRLDKEEGYFYPTGRCATILSMHILYDKDGYIAGLKNRLSAYPQELAGKLVRHHTGKMNNVEDFERAIARQEVLFYHSTLESSLDHFLQALFALNRCYFPSRKRTMQFINDFAAKPERCAERLLQTIELGAKPETLSQSYDVWSSLCRELLDMTEQAK